MISNLYIENGCFTKHPFINGCWGSRCDISPEFQTIQSTFLVTCWGGTTRPLVALVTDGLSASGKQALQRSGWMLLEVGLIGHEGQDICQPFVVTKGGAGC